MPNSHCYPTLWTHPCHWIVCLKVVTMVNFILCLFHQSNNFLMWPPDQQHLYHLLKMPVPGPHLRLTESETLSGASMSEPCCSPVWEGKWSQRGRKGQGQVLETLVCPQTVLGPHPADRGITRDFKAEIDIVIYVGLNFSPVSKIICAHCRKLRKLNQLKKKNHPCSTTGR